MLTATTTALGEILKYTFKEIAKDLVFGTIADALRPVLVKMAGDTIGAFLAASIGPYIAAFAIIGFAVWWFSKGRKLKGMDVSPPVIGMIVSASAFIVCFFWWLTINRSPPEPDYSSEPIQWDFFRKQTNFLSGKTTDYGVEIRGFQAHGVNRSGGPLENLGGFVRSEATGEKYELYLRHRNRRVPLKNYRIPDDGQFYVMADFFDGEGIPVIQFRSKFRKLTFEFNYNQSTYSRTFTAEEVDAQAVWLEEFLKPEPKQGIIEPQPLSKEDKNE